MSDRRTKVKGRPAGTPISLRLSDELESELAAAVVETGLSKSDLARLAIERGLKIVRRQLETPVEPVPG